MEARGDDVGTEKTAPAPQPAVSPASPPSVAAAQASKTSRDPSSPKSKAEPEGFSGGCTEALDLGEKDEDLKALPPTAATVAAADEVDVEDEEVGGVAEDQANGRDGTDKRGEKAGTDEISGTEELSGTDRISFNAIADQGVRPSAAASSLLSAISAALSLSPVSGAFETRSDPTRGRGGACARPHPTASQIETHTHTDTQRRTSERVATSERLSTSERVSPRVESSPVVAHTPIAAVATTGHALHLGAVKALVSEVKAGTVEGNAVEGNAVEGNTVEDNEAKANKAGEDKAEGVKADSVMGKIGRSADGVIERLQGLQTTEGEDGTGRRRSRRKRDSFLSYTPFSFAAAAASGLSRGDRQLETEAASGSGAGTGAGASKAGAREAVTEVVGESGRSHDGLGETAGMAIYRRAFQGLRGKTIDAFLAVEGANTRYGDERSREEREGVREEEREGEGEGEGDIYGEGEVDEEDGAESDVAMGNARTLIAARVKTTTVFEWGRLLAAHAVLGGLLLFVVLLGSVCFADKWSVLSHRTKSLSLHSLARYQTQMLGAYEASPLDPQAQAQSLKPLNKIYDNKIYDNKTYEKKIHEDYEDVHTSPELTPDLNFMHRVLYGPAILPTGQEVLPALLLTSRNGANPNFTAFITSQDKRNYVAQRQRENAYRDSRSDPGSHPSGRGGNRTIPNFSNVLICTSLFPIDSLPHFPNADRMVFPVSGPLPKVVERPTDWVTDGFLHRPQKAEHDPMDALSSGLEYMEGKLQAKAKKSTEAEEMAKTGATNERAHESESESQEIAKVVGAQNYRSSVAKPPALFHDVEYFYAEEDQDKPMVSIHDGDLPIFGLSRRCLLWHASTQRLESLYASPSPIPTSGNDVAEGGQKRTSMMGERLLTGVDADGQRGSDEGVLRRSETASPKRKGSTGDRAAKKMAVRRREPTVPPLFSLSGGMLAPNYPLRRQLEWFCSSWLFGALILVVSWLHSLSLPQPVTIIHAPRLIIYLLLALWRSLALFAGLGLIESLEVSQAVLLSVQEKLTSSLGASFSGNNSLANLFAASYFTSDPTQGYGVEMRSPTQELFDFSDHIVYFSFLSIVIATELQCFRIFQRKLRDETNPIDNPFSLSKTAGLLYRLVSLSFLALMLYGCFVSSAFYHSPLETFLALVIVFAGILLPLWLLLFFDLFQARQYFGLNAAIRPRPTNLTKTIKSLTHSA